jgi:hypothetical protein
MKVRILKICKRGMNEVIVVVVVVAAAVVSTVLEVCKKLGTQRPFGIFFRGPGN